jgi:hypothetical protein
MQVKMRRHFTGAFQGVKLGSGAWRLVDASNPPVEIFLRGVEQNASEKITDVQIEWHARGALLTGYSGGRATRIEASSIIIHEPLERLYEALPLARFDHQAQTFWRRVFWLVRIPGGRHLLGALARMSRKRS